MRVYISRTVKWRRSAHAQLLSAAPCNDVSWRPAKTFDLRRQANWLLRFSHAHPLLLSRWTRVRMDMTGVVGVSISWAVYAEENLLRINWISLNSKVGIRNALAHCTVIWATCHTCRSWHANHRGSSKMDGPLRDKESQLAELLLVYAIRNVASSILVSVHGQEATVYAVVINFFVKIRVLVDDFECIMHSHILWKSTKADLK